MTSKGSFMNHIAAPSVAFIFDCDGTLVNSSPVWGHAQTELLRRHGVDVTVDDFAQFEHLSLEDECQAYHDTWGIGANGEGLYRELSEILMEGYSKVPPREGLLAFLEQAKEAGIAMCVATSTPAKLVQSALAGAGAWVFEDAVFGLKSSGAAGFKRVGVYDLHGRMERDEVRINCDIFIDSYEDLDLARVLEFEG